MAKKSKKNSEQHVEVTEKEVKSTEETFEKEDGQTSEESPKKELTCEERYAELNNKYIMLYSDFDNYRKRTIKEKGELIAAAGSDVILSLLEVLDDFERAITNNEKVDDADKLKEGFELIFHKLNRVLESQGLEKMEAKGEVFNADLHEAITNTPVEKEEDKGKIVDVIERGYNLKGKPLRYAKVIVGQ